MMFGLIDSANVYTPNATDGDFTMLAQSGLACRLAVARRGPEDVGGEREDIGARRRLLWEAAYTMPDEAQVEVGGVRWNVLAGTFSDIRGPDGSVVYRRCEVTKVV